MRALAFAIVLSAVILRGGLNRAARGHPVESMSDLEGTVTSIVGVASLIGLVVCVTGGW